ncbi:GNAT family N-acetyltransferase [Myxococcus sp. MxC21-1]|uniref:GNAT family N-acetyltransferase n=1 Tax=Myxococcus sp. MxC21-1 TaxID=3041439 RepID=UPI00292E31F7|nr:GNAT family N-acetyltransferase [Myxococcus sp. MxC21-1]WNZ62789.1 GNAT family N-acetyltransferase [Myxococcus sp. MxC21-1]
MIETARLFVKKWTPDMAEAFLDLSQDPGFTLFPITDYRQSSVESARQWIEKNVGKYAVLEKATGNLIGMGGLTPWKLENESLVDLTYRLRNSAHGKGYGYELAQALVNYGFHNLQLKQITAAITPDNIPSIKLAEKLGMKFDCRIELLGVPTDLFRLFNQEQR